MYIDTTTVKLLTQNHYEKSRLNQGIPFNGTVHNYTGTANCKKPNQ